MCGGRVVARAAAWQGAGAFDWCVSGIKQGEVLMARTCHSSAAQSAELVTVELTRHDLNRLKALAKGLGWPAKKRQASLNTVFGFGLEAAEEILWERECDLSKRRRRS